MEKSSILPAINAELIGDRLRELRQDKDYTQKQIAEILGVTVKTYREWELGKSVISTSAVFSLSGLYSVSADYLLGRSAYKAVNGHDVAKITGLSDSAIDELARMNGGADPVQHPAADTISKLLSDNRSNGSGGVLATIRRYLVTDPERMVRSSATTGADLPAGGLYGFEFNLGAALLLQLSSAMQGFREKEKMYKK